MPPRSLSCQETEPSEVAETGGGVLLAVGPVVAFFTWWSWWTAAGFALTAAGALWLALAAGARNGSWRAPVVSGVGGPRLGTHQHQAAVHDE
ncbi:hypothetical protein SAMN04489729_8007 [Amycolatopsis lurida]|nr:hypothetical protein SAMN04489729_8007 [Amycolatopsis lurida]